jgi:hypothetical protein
VPCRLDWRLDNCRQVLAAAVAAVAQVAELFQAAVHMHATSMHCSRRLQVYCSRCLSWLSLS